MPLKEDFKKPVNPRIAKMVAAKAAKREAEIERRVAVELAKRKPSEPDYNPNYGEHYGDAAQPIERRPLGTQPNSRARNAVERAEERMRAPSRRDGRKKQMPGMDIDYYADRDLRDQRAQHLDDDPDSLGEGEEVFGVDETEPAPAPKAARMENRRYQAEHRLPQRAPIRRNEAGRILVQSRDGRIISRTSFATGDKFDVPAHFFPDGWTYQWLSQGTLGKPNNNAHFYANGWEPVPASRHDGVYMQKGHEGPIIVDDMMLVERRVELTLEARAEEVGRAKDLLRTQNEQFRPPLPDARRHHGTALRAKRTIERLPEDIGQPSLVVDDGSYDTI